MPEETIVAVGLTVAFTVLVVVAVVAALGYVIDGSVPDESNHVSPSTPLTGP